ANLEQADALNIVLGIIVVSLPVLGMVQSLFILMALEVARSVIRRFKEERSKVEKEINDYFGTDFPLTVGLENEEQGHKTGNLPYSVFPITIFFVWMALLVGVIVSLYEEVF
ncbi:MAG: hypothetical protein AAGA45_06455, partial [Verrucomicrobiota bacterium]